LKQKTVGRSSVLSGLFTLDAVVITSGIYGLINTTNPITIWFIVIVITLFIVFSLICFGYLLLKNPKLLHSEKFLIEDKYLDYVAKKGEVPQLIENVKIVSPIENLID
jgi:hypothetical protein